MINTLGTAQSGLQSSQLAIDNISNNIANENTEGYIKRTVNLSEIDTYDNSYGNGVQVDSIDRQMNEYLYYNYLDEYSKENYYSEVSSINESIEIIFTETNESGLSKDLDNYYQSIEDLRSDPSNIIYQTNLEQESNDLVNQLQGLYTDLEELEDSIEDQLNDEVEEVNKILNQITEINNDINMHGESYDLLDKRELLEKELSTYADIEVINDEFYELKIAGETAIFNNTLAYELNVVNSPTSQKDVYDTSSLSDSNLTDGEIITLTLDNTNSIEIVIDTTGISETDTKEQIVNAINNDNEFNSKVIASIDSSGNLVIESKEEGADKAFDLSIVHQTNSEKIAKNDNLSKKATDDVHVEVLDEELYFSTGSLNALTQNLQTDNENNSIQEYKETLDEIAYSLSDISSSYVIGEEGEYIYGDDATELSSTSGTLISIVGGTETYSTSGASLNNINLFTGSSVMTLNVNDESINDLSQNDLDYLSSVQWKDDLNISSSDGQSFSESIQELRVSVASSKENSDFKLDTQEAINISLLSNYEQITKVDSDEELINLMQFQSAYEANAKVITVVDEMLQTLLAM